MEDEGKVYGRIVRGTSQLLMVADVQESTLLLLLMENGTEARLVGNGVMVRM